MSTAIASLDPSTAAAATTLAEYEDIIRRGLNTFIEVGTALLAIRDSRLYREIGYTRFEDYCQQRWGMDRRYANRQIEAASIAGILGPMGPIPESERAARELAPLRDNPAELAAAWQDAVERSDGRPTAEVVREVVTEYRTEHVRGTFGTGENDWHTPDKYLTLARAVLGTIDLDPASSIAAQQRVQATQFYTEQDNGLKQPWNGRVWLNPPYAQPYIAYFVSKLVSEIALGNVASAILLTHNYTDTAWFHEAQKVASAVCFTKGRIRFVDAAGTIAAPTQGQVFLYFGNDSDTFCNHFKAIGACSLWLPYE